MNTWVAFGAVPFDAVKVSVTEPAAVCLGGMPESVTDPPVDGPMVSHEEGSVPLVTTSESVAVGTPAAVTWYELVALTVNVSDEALVKCGGPSTTSVKDCVAFEPMPLFAVIVNV